MEVIVWISKNFVLVIMCYVIVSHLVITMKEKKMQNKISEMPFPDIKNWIF